MREKIDLSRLQSMKSPGNLQGVTNLIDNTRAKVVELVDVLDIDSFRRGYIKVVKTITKDEAHENRELHQAGHVWLYNDKGEILLQKRSIHKSSDPGLWDISAAGHISSGETMEEGTIREAFEELGLDISKIDSKMEKVFSFVEDVIEKKEGKIKYNYELNTVYIAKFNGDINNLTRQQEEVDELKFIPIEQLELELKDPRLKKQHVLQRNEYYDWVFGAIKKRLKK